ncbi:MAG: hypothetical protein MZV70_17370 [Desulfobacterales bacterium]|nr:hypothetical protein [Desulfobacterales bacterium]
MKSERSSPGRDGLAEKSSAPWTSAARYARRSQARLSSSEWRLTGVGPDAVVANHQVQALCFHTGGAA